MGFMNLFKTFLGNHWGVHPADHKRPASEQAIRRLPLAPRLHLMLSQHVGAPARPVVLVGQKVLKGELIAAAQGNISAPLHAPTSGVITAMAGKPEVCGAVTSPIAVITPEVGA